MKALIWRPQNGAISERMKDFVSGGRSVSKTFLAKSLRRYEPWQRRKSMRRVDKPICRTNPTNICPNEKNFDWRKLT
jgi:hypothetical protein